MSHHDAGKDTHQCLPAESDFQEPATPPEVSQRTLDFVKSIKQRLTEGRLPLEVYNNSEIYELEKSRIFANTWVYIGHETEITENGDYVRRSIAEDPFILVRDEAGEIHVLFDSCRHRGAKVCRAEKGNTSHFRCPYHGWTYKNSGELAGLPRMREGYERMDLSEWGLVEAPRVTNYKGLIFASMNASVPDFEEYIGDFKWYLDIHLDLTEGGMQAVGDPFRYNIGSNWKIGAENFAGDGYHTPVTHQSAVDTFVESDWSWEGERSYQFISDIEGYYASSTLMGLFEEDVEAYWGYPAELRQHFEHDGLSEAQWEIARRSAIHVATIFPNLSIHHQNITLPDGQPLPFLSLRNWSPRGPDQMEVLNTILAPKEASERIKEKIHRAALYSFGPSGNFDQDDVAVWSGIVESAGSTFAREHNLELNYKMGHQEIGNPEEDASWEGPGYSSKVIHEGYARTFHGNWVQAMDQSRSKTRASSE